MFEIELVGLMSVMIDWVLTWATQYSLSKTLANLKMSGYAASEIRGLRVPA
jgi:hypothetical protein